MATKNLSRVFGLGLIWSCTGLAYALGFYCVYFVSWHPTWLAMIDFGLIACAAALSYLALCYTIPGFGTLHTRLMSLLDEDAAAFQPGSTRGQFGRALDRAGNVIKDFFLDLGISEESSPPRPVPPLPPIHREAFIAATRPRVEEVLSRVADTINERPSASEMQQAAASLAPLLQQLEMELIEEGRRLRTEAALAALPRPQGEWARRYREMVVASLVEKC